MSVVISRKCDLCKQDIPLGRPYLGVSGIYMEIFSGEHAPDPEEKIPPEDTYHVTGQFEACSIACLNAHMQNLQKRLCDKAFQWFDIVHEEALK